MEQAADALGGIDVLVNNASGFGMGDSEEGWKRGLDVDVMATVRASRAALPHLRAAKGCIGNTTSISGLGPSVRTLAYAAVKALLINHTASQAAALAKDGIRVNAIAPGSIESPAAPGRGGGRKTRRSIAVSRRALPSAGSARRRRWRMWRCSSPPRSRAG